MTTPPNPPSLPDIRAAAQSASPQPAAASYSGGSAKAGFGGTQRLQKAVIAISGGGAALVAVVCAGQLALRPGLRPSDLMATIEAQTELGVMNQRLGYAPGEMVITEAAYRAKMAEAERTGQAKAEFALQQKLAVVQANQQRVVAAYNTLYNRANMIAQIAMQMESVAQQFRQQLLTMSNGGRNTVIMFKDIFCGLGDAEACASAHSDRQVMISESDELSRGDAGKRVRELMEGIDDPATLVAHEDQRRNGVPALADR